MTSSPRWVVVNDNDEGIKYSGPWLKQQGNALDSLALGSFGTPYRGDWHQVTESASLSYTFDGTWAIIQGTSDVHNTSGVLDPSSECSVDGVKVKNPNPFLFPANNWGLCEVKNLSNGSHVITLNITTTGRPFYLDRIRYTPTTSLENPPTNQSLLIRYTDSRISYDSNWKDSNLGGMATSQMGASMVFSFFGTSLSCFAENPQELSRLPARGNYSIDDEPPTTFEISPVAAGLSRHNQLLFQLPTRPQANHTLKVTYISGTGVAPLVLSSLIVHNDAGAPVPSDAGVPVPSDANLHSKKTPIGAIVGGVVGGVVFIVAVILLAWYFVHRRRRSPKTVDEAQVQVQPFPPNAPPIAHLPPTMQVGRSGKGSSAHLNNVSTASSVGMSSSSASMSQTNYQTTSLSSYPQTIQHDDSGYRPQDGAAILELPPTYTKATA